MTIWTSDVWRCTHLRLIDTPHGSCVAGGIDRLAWKNGRFAHILNFHVAGIGYTDYPPLQVIFFGLCITLAGLPWSLYRVF